MLAAGSAQCPPGHVVKLGLLSKGSEKTVTLTLGTMLDERQAMQPRRKRECR